MNDTGSLRDRAERFADHDDWQSVRELLAGRPADVLLRDGLAYRFGEALYFTGRVKELSAYAAEYHEAARATTDPSAVLETLNLKGIAAFELGRMEEAEENFDLLVEQAAAECANDLLAKAVNNLGALANLRGHPERAISQYHLALPLYRRLGNGRGLSQTHHNLGMSYRDLRRLDAAADEYRKAIEVAQEFDLLPQIAMSTIGRAEVAILSGDAAFGLRMAEWGRAASVRLGDPISEGTALRIRALARTSLAPPDWLDALSDLAAASALARRTGHALLAAETERDMGRLERERGNLPAARQHLAEALELLSEIGAIGQVEVVESEIEALDGGPALA